MSKITDLRRERFIQLSELFKSQKEFSRAINSTPGYINQLLSGHRSIGEKAARKIEAACNKPDGWIDQIGQATNIEQALPTTVIQSNAHETRKLGEFSRIPVVGSAQLGDNGHWSELEYPVGNGDGYITFPTNDKNAYALRCVGDSMKPRIKDGEFVIVEPNTEVQPGEEVLLKTLDGRVMVKTFLYKKEDRIHLISINEAYPPQSILLSEIDKIHAVVAIARKAKWRSE